MSSLLNSLKFYLKSVAFGSLLSVFALYGVIASIVLRLIGKSEYSQYTVARAFYYTFSTLLGVKITIKNEKYLFDKPGIFISNHQSALDIFVLGRIFQPGFTVTAKKALQYVPFLGWFMLLSGTFFLDRSKGEKARKVLEKGLLDLKKKKHGLFMFPEGTRSGFKELGLLPFKKGAFHLAKQGGIHVVPIVVSNTSTIFHAKSKTFNTGEIVIEVLEPLSTKDLVTNEDVTKFTEDVRKRMLDKLQQIGYSKTKSTSAKSSTTTENEPDNTESEGEVEVISESASEETPLVSK